MKYSLEVWSSDWKQIERTCQTAERLGYDAFYYGESPTALNLDCWTVLAALARATRSIRLGPVISNILPQYRSLPLLAKQAATLAVLSEGRLDFRTGAGAARRYADPWWRPFGIEYPDHAARLELLERAIPRLRALWAGTDAAAGASLGLSHPPIPITIAAVGPAGIACAARHADVWEASYRTPEEFAALASQLTQEQSGLRRPRHSLEVDVFVAARRERMLPLLAEVEAQRGAQRSARVVERSLHGTPAEVVAQLGRLRSAGVEELVLAFHDPHDAAALEAFAEAMHAASRCEQG